MIAHINGINIFYEKRGAGKPLLLLHGNGESHDSYIVHNAKIAKLILENSI